MSIPGIRATVAMAVISGLTHLLALLFSLALFAAGAFILFENVKALSIPLLVAVLVLFALALLIAIPAQTKDAAAFIEVHIVPYLPMVGGRRRDDPPSTPQ